MRAAFALFAAPLITFSQAACDDSPSAPTPPAPSAIGCAAEPDGAPCEDGDACTNGDTCRGQVCVPGVATVCEAIDDCHSAGACNRTTGVCSDPQLENGTLCDDGALCTTLDTCVEGVCQGGAPRTCEATDDCHAAGQCDPSTGECTNPEQPDGSPCDDLNACTVADQCAAGRCEPGAEMPCQPETACLAAGTCDPQTGGCTQLDKPDGIACDDGSACTSSTTCDAGTCGGGEPIVCPAAAACHFVERCDPSSGCVEAFLPDGSGCDDGNACTVNDTCRDGGCGGGSPLDCSAPDGCKLDGACDTSVGCIWPSRPDGTVCDDLDLCTQVDACVNGACIGSDPLTCTASDQCHEVGVCDPMTGVCTDPQQLDGVSCDDTNACTRTDLCQGGMCTGTDPIPGEIPCSEGMCFSDVTRTASITVTSTSTRLYMGAGGGFVDIDNDGLADILITSEEALPRLYRNRGDGTFEDITATSGFQPFSFPDLLLGATLADYDNDGDQDIYFVARGANRLMQNDGTGRFTDVTAAAGVGDPRWSSSAAFADPDGDGDLDLYVGNYIAVQNFPDHTPHPNTFYRNEGDGTFTDATALHGLAGAGTTLAVSWSDYDGDGLIDLLVCNDFGAFIEPNQLYRNTGGGLPGFVEISAAVGFDAAIYCMGITAGDYDRDGDLDYYFSNIGQNVFLENQGAAGFVDRTIDTGTDLTRDMCLTTLFTTSWGVGFHDFDNDGWLDLYVSNGFVPAVNAIANARESSNTLFKSTGAGLGFEDVSGTAGLGDPQIGRGAAFADYDRDGDVDILQMNVAGTPVLFRNNHASNDGFLRVRARGRISARQPIGLRLTAELPGLTLIRELNPNYSFEASSESIVHFGLGAASEVDRLRMRWPSGITQTLIGVARDNQVEVTEPLLTVETATASVDGASIATDVTVRNRSTGALTALYALELTAASGPVASFGTFEVAAGTTASARLFLALPVGTSTGAASLRVSIRDSGAGLDQTGLSVVISAP